MLFSKVKSKSKIIFHMLRFAGSRAFAAVAQQGVEVFVNNVAVTVPMGSAIIQACEKAGAAV